MFKFNAGRIESRMAILIGFGFEEENLRRMVEDDDPVGIRGADLKLEKTNFAVFYAGSGPDTFKDKFKLFVDGMKDQKGFKEPDGQVQVMQNTDQHFFMTPLSFEDSTLFVIGLTDRAVKNMRDGNFLTYRVRLISGNGDNHEVLMFSGKDNESMKRQFSSLIR